MTDEQFERLSPFMRYLRWEASNNESGKSCYPGQETDQGRLTIIDADLAPANVSCTVSACVADLRANIDSALFADGSPAHAALDLGPGRILLVATSHEAQAVAGSTRTQDGLSHRRLIGPK